MGRMCWRACAAGAAGAASSRGGAAGRASDDAPICAGLHVRRARAASHPCPCFLAPVQVVRRSSASAAAPACERCGPSGCGPSPGVPPPLTTILCSCSPCTGCGFWLALFWLALGCMAMGVSWAQMVGVHVWEFITMTVLVFNGARRTPRTGGGCTVAAMRPPQNVPSLLPHLRRSLRHRSSGRKPLFPSSRPARWARWAWVCALQSTAAHCGCPFECPFKRPFKCD